MAKFHFRLGRVLEWYRTQCRLEENRLALCLIALNQVQENIARLKAESLAIEREVISGGALSGRDLAALGYYRLRIGLRTAELEADHLRCRREVDQQVSVVQTIQRRLRLVEKLRERRLTEYLQAEDRELEAVAAESYLSKWTAARRVQ